VLSVADAVALAVDGYNDDFDSEGCSNTSIVTMMNESHSLCQQDVSITHMSPNEPKLMIIMSFKHNSIRQLS